jgi:hypothetical protein
VRLDALDFLMEDRAQAQVALADAEGILGLTELDIPTL